MSPLRRSAALLLLAWLAPACDATPPAPAPVSVQGAVVIEPPTIGVGQTAWIEIAVVTPPDHRLQPPAAPAELPGLWLLEADAPRVERHASHWVHRARFRVRARRTGTTSWPAQSVILETADGTETALRIEARPIVVEEIALEFPDRIAPFGLRRPAPRGPAPGVLLPAVAGAAVALTCVGLVALVRRARRADAATPRTAAPAAPWRAAQAALATARDENDPRVAAGRASAALRLYVSHQYGVAAHTATTEELEGVPAPRGLGARWDELLLTLRRLDDLRFRPPPEPGPAEDAELGAALRDAQALLSELLPRGERLSRDTPPDPQHPRDAS